MSRASGIPSQGTIDNDHPSLDASEQIRLDGALLEFLLENIPDRIYFKDRQSRFLRISRALAELFSLKDRSLAIGRTDFDFFTPEHAEPAYADEQKIIRTGDSLVGKVEKETLPDGKVLWVLTTKMPLRDTSGEIIGTCGISKDFTDQKMLEESLEHSLAELQKTHQKLKSAQQELLEAEKIQSLGRLAFGVAHEVRNPLNTLSMAVEFLSAQPSIGNDPQITGVLSMMKEATSRADAVIQELMDAVGTMNFALESCALAPIIRDVIDDFRPTLERAGIVLIVEVPADLPLVPVDHSRIKDALAEVIKNAVDAMKSGGSLALRARALRLTEAAAEKGSRVARKLRTGDQIIRLEVEDTGSGIPAESLGSIFDPFFTTKPTGEGTGLGLTVCRKIIELHGGTLSVKNRLDAAGTLVTIDLPAPLRSFAATASQAFA